MKFFRSSFIRFFFSLSLALIVLNLSIDPPDVLKNLDKDVELEEDLSVNEMESISELLLEKVLDIENAVPENEEDDEKFNFKKYAIFHLSNSLIYNFNNLPLIEVNERFFIVLNLDSVTSEIHSPPPEILA